MKRILTLLLIAALLLLSAAAWAEETPEESAGATAESAEAPAESAEAPAESAGRLLSPGDKNDEVTALQLALASLGLYHSYLDGDYGVGTEKCVSAFQESAGLPVTGIADEATLTALENAVPAPRIRVESAADMTDTSQIYLYEGNEKGYKPGNWYFYNERSGNWRPGGEDTTKIWSFRGQLVEAAAFTGDGRTLYFTLAMPEPLTGLAPSAAALKMNIRGGKGYVEQPRYVDGGYDYAADPAYEVACECADGLHVTFRVTKAEGAWAVEEQGDLIALEINELAVLFRE